MYWNERNKLLQSCMLSIFVFFLSSSLLAQSLKIDPANMSTSDRKKNFTCIGNGESGSLVLLDKQGIIWEYDGYQLLKWNEEAIENGSFVQHLFLRDSFLYAITNDALVVFEKDEKKAQLIKRSKNHYFTIKDGVHYFSESNNLYSLQEKKIKRQSSKNFALRNRLKVENDQKEFIYYGANSIYWKNADLETIAFTELDDVDQIIVDRWNGNWLLIKGKLHRLELNRAGENVDLFSFEGSRPQKMKQSANSIYGVYENRKLVEWTNGQSVLIADAEDVKIKDYWIDNNRGVWILDEDKKMYFLNRGEWFSWSKSELSIEDAIVGIAIEKDIVSIIFENAGIIQSRIKAVNEDWIWVPHRLNRQLKNLSVRAFAQRVDVSRSSRKLHLFTENFGIFVISQKGLGILKEGFPSFGVTSVVIEDEYAVLLDKGKRWHKFIFGQAERKSFQKLEPKRLPPEINTDQFLLDDGNIVYSSEDQLIVLDVTDYNYSAYSWDAEIDEALIWNRQIYQCGNKNCQVFSIPSQALDKLPPRLKEVWLETVNDERYQLFPANSDTIDLVADDFPVKMMADARYIAEPKAIEYAWNSADNGSLDKDYQYKSEMKWKVPDDGIYSNAIRLKIDDVEIEHALQLIRVETPIEKSDNTWAIYLSAFLAGLLVLLFLGTRWRSKAQKRKIQQLKMEKKTMELEQKALQLQMNPHFIFNALNGVKGMIALGENKKARQYLTKVSGWIRNMLNDARSDKITMEQELSNLKSYLEIEQELQGNTWTFSIELDEQIDPHFYIPPMMIQPFVENAIIHAFKGIPYTGKIDLRFIRKGKRIQVEIEDNGVGLKESDSKDHQSVALEVIKDRLNLLNDGTEMEGFSLINKADFVGSGVLVKILLPILD